MTGKRVSFEAILKNATFELPSETYISHPLRYDHRCIYCGKELADNESMGTYEGSDGTLLGLYHIECKGEEE